MILPARISLPRLGLVLALSISPLAVAAQTAPEEAATRCVEMAGPPDAGVPISPEAQDAARAALQEAAPFCEQAMADGGAAPEVLFHLGVIRQAAGDHDAAIAAFEAAAEAGLATAETKLGDYHLFGIGPLGRDAETAAGHFRAGAEGGDPAAQMTLGLLHRLGAGVPRDAGRMVALMREAADAGYHFAQFRLGQTYLTGEGVPGGQDAALGIPDREAAARYLSMAAEQGNIEAVLELARLYGDGDGSGGGDPAQQLRWTERAAEAGLPDAIAALGFLYERGRGAEADPERAARLYVEALETGDVSMDDLRGQLGGSTPRWDRDTAIAFQQILQERGLYAGAIDGVIGPMSRAAARALND
ncbi:sel1 repeat family protein [Rhodobacteraceae bacterium W635]|uniref:tetratricopeptide repeat protein n=1 Tax=Nioella halotolerans TaxID=2303578 RepID=UPI000E3D4659|nr:sel1 repeat family protein [Rhodobacteraceae bacterium W635]